MINEIILPFPGAISFELIAVDKTNESVIGSTILLSQKDVNGKIIGTVKNNTTLESPTDIPEEPDPAFVPPASGAAPQPRDPSPNRLISNIRIELESNAPVGYDNKTVTFKVKVNGDEVDKTTNPFSWSLSQINTPSLPPTSAGGAAQPGRAPVINAVTGEFTGGTSGSTAKIRVAIAPIHFEIMWPSDWPKFKDDNNAWLSDPEGRLAMEMFYGVFKQMPQKIQEGLRDVSVYRGKPQLHDRAYFFPNYVHLPNNLIINLTNTSVSQDWRECYYITTIIHELGHAYMGIQCQSTIVIVIVEIAAILSAFVAAMIFTTPVGGCIALPFLLDFGLSSLATVQDYMSVFCRAVQWEMSNYQLHAVPILGWLLGAIFRQTPNYAYASTGNNQFLRNLWGLDNTTGKIPGFTPDFYDWRSRQMCSDYSLNNPQEDFAECISSFTFTEHIFQHGHHNGAHTSRKISDARKTFMESEFFGTAWTDVGFQQIFKYRGFRFNMNALGAPKAPVKSKSLNTKAQKKGSSGELAEKINQLNALMEQAFGYYDEDLQKASTTTRNILNELPELKNASTPIHLARTLELYESGLQRWSTSSVLTSGDLLLDKQGKIWIVAKTDEKGSPIRIVGDKKISAEITPQELQFNLDNIWYYWKPGKAPRTWPGINQTWTPALASNGAEVMRNLIMLWGETTAIASKRNLTEGRDFFREYLSFTQIEDQAYPFSHPNDMTDVLNYCRTHGQGLMRYEANNDQLYVGDVIFLYHENTVAIITRTQDGKPQDILYGGLSPSGMLGEPGSSVKMFHGIDANEIRYWWRPDGSPKKWSNPD